MKNRTRRRWLRRLAIGLSFATFAAPAAARPDGASVNASVASPQAAVVRPDDRADRFTGIQRTELAVNPVRPDDRADRFASSDGSPARASGTDGSVSWDGALTLGLGSLVLVLALGLGLGYIRRPRIAGL